MNLIKKGLWILTEQTNFTKDFDKNVRFLLNGTFMNINKCFYPNEQFFPTTFKNVNEGTIFQNVLILQLYK